MIKIIGDIILDIWIRGNYKKISPEAPVKILEQENILYNLGGAGNVALNLKTFNQKIKLYSAISNDRSGLLIKKFLKKNKINCFLSNKLKITTTKTRLIRKNGKHITRIDNEKYQNDKSLEAKYIAEIKRDDYALVIDYNKGIIGKNLIKKLLNKTSKIYVDPKNKPNVYKGAFLVKPNMKRLKNWIGAFEKKKCFSLLKKNNWKWLVVTDGPNGVHIFNSKIEYKKIPVLTNNLKDVSGAGDTFLSTLVNFHSEGLNVFHSCEMAAIASTKVVEKLGVQPIKKNELLFEKVFTNGVFDLLHKGHYELFKYCKKIGKKLVVGINSDQSVKKIKGNERPFYPLNKRILNLKKIKIIDKIISFNQRTPINLIKKIKPNLIVKGGDYTKKKVVGNKYAEVFIFPYIEGYSSTKLIKKLKKK